MGKEKEFTRQIGKKIRRLRGAKDLSLTALAKRAGVSKSYLSHIETGKVENVSLNVLRKIAAALKIDLFELIGNISKPNGRDTSTYDFPFSKEELERLASESGINENMLDEKTEDTLVSLGKVLTDPDLPVKYLDELEEKLCSYARWLSDRMKEKNRNSGN